MRHFERADANGDGLLSFEEFSAYLRDQVLKTMHARHTDATTLAEAFRDEVLLLRELRHPNIVQLIGGSWDVASGDMCLVLELCSRGALDSLLANRAV